MPRMWEATARTKCGRVLCDTVDMSVVDYGRLGFWTILSVVTLPVS